MPSIAERKRRRQESAMLRQARLDLLAELDQLKDKMCEKCRRPVSGAQFTCNCPAATRMREIGKELSASINERTKIELPKKEVKQVAKKNKPPVITEEAVNEMKESGMTYAAIAKHFGISAPTLGTRRQNWELERVRKQHKQEENIADQVKVQPSEKDSMTRLDEIPSNPSLSATHEAEICELKANLLEKDEFIQKQWNSIDKLTAERDELAKKNETSGDRQGEIKNDQKLLAILLERETARIKNLVEVG